MTSFSSSDTPGANSAVFIGVLIPCHQRIFNFQGIQELICFCPIWKQKQTAVICIVLDSGIIFLVIVCYCYIF